MKGDGRRRGRQGIKAREENKRPVSPANGIASSVTAVAFLHPFLACMRVTSAGSRSTRAASFPASRAGSGRTAGARARTAGARDASARRRSRQGGRLFENALAASNDGGGTATEVVANEPLERRRGVGERVDHVLEHQQQRRLVVLCSIVRHTRFLGLGFRI